MYCDIMAFAGDLWMDLAMFETTELQAITNFFLSVMLIAHSAQVSFLDRFSDPMKYTTKFAGEELWNFYMRTIHDERLKNEEPRVGGYSCH